MNHRSFSLVVLLLLGGAFLPAADIRGGVQGGLSLPQGDLADVANMGLHLGGHLRWDYGRGHGLMARGEFTPYGKKNGVTTNTFLFGADYTYHIDRNRRGVYVLAGLSHLNANYSGWGRRSGDSGIGFSFGGGMDMDRNLGFQVRFNSHSVDNATLASLNLGVTWTF